ncbi:MAG TPA: hypothetical protein VN541_04270 [Tepidisphaeraceae bacterium]|nr:hypothetical protein [Tepidisphaeraceae bacterium]
MAMILLPIILAQADLSPPKMVWPGVVIIVLIALFVTAAVTGPLIRANSDDPVDASSSATPHDATEE